MDDFIIQTEMLLTDEEHANNNDPRTGINQIYPREIKTYVFYIKRVKLKSEKQQFLNSKVSSSNLCPYMIFNESL